MLLLISILGLFIETLGQLELAIESYTMVLGLEPNSTAACEVYNNRGLVYLDKDDFELAIQDFNTVITLQPEFIPAYVNRAAAYLRRGQVDLAIEDYTSVIRLDPKLAMAYYSRGIAWLSLERMGKSQSRYNCCQGIGGWISLLHFITFTELLRSLNGNMVFSCLET